MTIDEAIIHCKEVAIRKLKNKNNAKCVQCGEEHVQLAKWLKELKAYKSREDVVPVIRCKDCRKRRKDGYCTKFIQNISGIASAWYMPQDDDFCSYGERKE